MLGCDELTMNANRLRGMICSVHIRWHWELKIILSNRKRGIRNTSLINSISFFAGSELYILLSSFPIKLLVYYFLPSLNEKTGRKCKRISLFLMSSGITWEGLDYSLKAPAESLLHVMLPCIAQNISASNNFCSVA